MPSAWLCLASRSVEVRGAHFAWVLHETLGLGIPKVIQIVLERIICRSKHRQPCKRVAEVVHQASCLQVKGALSMECLPQTCTGPGRGSLAAEVSEVWPMAMRIQIHN